MPAGKPKDRGQAFLLQKYLHFYDQVNDGDISGAIQIFNDPFQRSATKPTNANTSSAKLIEKKMQPDREMKIKLANGKLDSYITKL